MRAAAYVVVLGVALAGCGGEDHEDLKLWMKDAAKDVRGNIPPLPQVKPYEPLSYDAGDMVDPFKPSKLGVEQKKAGGSGLLPDLDRPKEPLENYPLETLKYVAIITKGKVSQAVILADGALHPVRVGMHMGQNFGVVTKITESEVTLKELVQDSDSDWVERESALMLQGQEGVK